MAGAVFEIAPSGQKYEIPNIATTSFYGNSTLESKVSNWQASMLKSVDEGEIEFHLTGSSSPSGVGTMPGDSNELTGGPVLNGLQIVPVIEFLQPEVNASGAPLEFGPLDPGVYALMHVHGAVNVGGSQPKYSGGWYRLVHSTNSNPQSVRINFPEVTRYTTGYKASEVYSGQQHIFSHQGGFITLSFDDISGHYDDNNNTTNATGVSTYIKEGVEYPSAQPSEPVAPVFALISISALERTNATTNPVIYHPSHGGIIKATTGVNIMMRSTTVGASIFYTKSSSPDGISEPADPVYPTITNDGLPGPNTYAYTPGSTINITVPTKFNAIAISSHLMPSPITSSYYFMEKATDAPVIVNTTPPQAPTSITASPGTDSNGGARIAVTWTPSDRATSYMVLRAQGGSTVFNPVAYPAGTTFINSGLTFDVNYCYKVVAINQYGQSAPSTQACATPVAAPEPPNIPTGVYAIGGDGIITVYWSPPYAGTYPSHYRIYAIATSSLSGSADDPLSYVSYWDAVNPNNNPLTSFVLDFSNLAPSNGTEYSILVGAYTTGIAGEMYATHVTATPYGLAAAPTITLTPRYTQCIVAFSDNATAATGPCTYSIYRAQSATEPAVDSGLWYYTFFESGATCYNTSRQYYVDNGPEGTLIDGRAQGFELTPNTHYYYKIVTTNALGAETVTISDRVTTNAITFASTTLTATNNAQNGIIDVAWSYVSSPATTPSSYKIGCLNLTDSQDAGITEGLTASPLYHRIPLMKRGYRYTLIAVLSTGEKLTAKTVDITAAQVGVVKPTVTPPSAPGRTFIMVNPTGGATRICVYRNGVAALNVPGNPGAGEVTIESPATNQEYTYTVPAGYGGTFTFKNAVYNYATSTTEYSVATDGVVIA